LDGWLEKLTNVQFVGTFRHPLAVAQSLHSRNEKLQSRNKNMSLEKGMNLWLIYNQRLLDFYNRFKFPIISFDIPVRVYKEKLLQLANKLELQPSSSDISFIDEGLKHQEPENQAELPASIQQVYHQLITIGEKSF
jgi:hypothetical protein